MASNGRDTHRAAHCHRMNLAILSATLLLTQPFASALLTTNIGRVHQASLLPRHASLQPNPFQNSPGTGRGRGKGSRTSVSWWSPSEETSSRLKVRIRIRNAFQRVRSQSSRLQESRDRESSTAESTWSQPGVKSSSLGVRSRVKDVLKKAQSRTGIINSSDQASGLWVAEVASIGGLAEDSDLVVKSERNGAAKTNGATIVNGGSSGKAALPPRVQLEVVRKSDVSSSPIFIPPNSTVLDGLRADVPTVLQEPLPFKLPKLTVEQEAQLLAGERVQEQSKMGGEGSGYVVMDVKAPPFIIWECLLDFENYPELIKTVRSMEMYTSNKLTSGYHAEKPVPAGTNRELRHYGIPSVTRASFVLSKFRLNIAAIHNYRPHPDGHYMIFNLDPECTNMVLQDAKGIWYTQSNVNGRGEEYTRVWLLCSLKVSSILPKFIVDYAAKRAMPRATNWLKPHVEPIAEQWAVEQQKHS